MILLIIKCMLLGIVATLTGIFYNYTLQSGSICVAMAALMLAAIMKKEFEED